MSEPVVLPPQRLSYPLPLHRPVATWVLLGLIVAAFAVETAAGGSTQTGVLVRLGAKVTVLIAAGEYWRLFSAMFLHIGLMHLFFNGYALLAIGTELERLIGPGRFLAIYLLGGLFGNLASYAFTVNLAAGASGAILGLIGALATFFTLYRRQLGAWGRGRLANILFLIALNLFLGFTQPGIDNLAHLGGLLSGLGLGWALAPRYRVEPLGLRLVDRNRLGRYWPALALAAALLLGGTVLVTAAWRNSPLYSPLAPGRRPGGEEGQRGVRGSGHTECQPILNHLLSGTSAYPETHAPVVRGFRMGQPGRNNETNNWPVIPSDHPGSGAGRLRR